MTYKSGSRRLKGIERGQFNGVKREREKSSRVRERVREKPANTSPEIKGDLRDGCGKMESGRD